MKSLIAFAAAAILSFSTCAQGTLAFSTFVSGQVNAPTYAPGQMAINGAGIGTLGTVHAQLFLVSSGTHMPGGNAVYTPLLPPTTFLTTGSGRHVVVPSENVVVPNRAAGETVSIIMRFWMGESFERASLKGETPLGGAATVRLGGQPASGPAIPPGNLVGLQGVELLIPEPSTIAFGLLGVAAFLYRRRR